MEDVLLIIMSQFEEVAANVHNLIQETLQTRLQQRCHTTRDIVFTNRVPLSRKLRNAFSLTIFFGGKLLTLIHVELGEAELWHLFRRPVFNPR
jgi:hypothetical protein